MTRAATYLSLMSGLSVWLGECISLICLSTGVALAAPPTLRPDAALIAQAGTSRGAPACISCHGARGEGLPDSGLPHLAGLNSQYLLTQLNAFASGQRAHPMMTPIAQILTVEERTALAQYYGAMQPTATASPTNIDAMGARLALDGRWSDGLPACSQCHGATGAGVGAVFPALAGQSAHYIEAQLRNWQQGARPPGPLGLMKTVASKLSPADIRAVAGYFAALSPPRPDKTGLGPEPSPQPLTTALSPARVNNRGKR